ncbi:uncharacterized protein LOC119354658 [Triticum dicoccoides]|uniref:uncharacterized protein LOC119354658 n=1 Tax=Triticum dicoccoides TaxID=85692 RepID=UPI000E79EB96|nr:uncharacterized protein LOC119354658 [Triticum dicoccoides]
MSSSDDELLLVQELPMDMHSDGGAPQRRLAHVLLPIDGAPGPPPFRPPPPPSAATAAEFRVAFRGWLGAPRHWELWVAKLRPIHERLWRELGIFDAVLASTYRIKRDASAVLHLASFWSPSTSTFVFPWGEATITLEDVAVLGGFPADGSPVPAPLPHQWRPDEAALNGVRLDFNRSACKKAHHAAWMKHFLTDTDMDAVIEHASFLALWLTRFVLPGHPESTMRQSLFPLAVRMARGDRVALGPAVLASLYRDLREMKTYLVAASATGGNAELLSPLSVHAPLYILQLWMWERFPVLWDGKPNLIKDGEPRAASWHDVSKKMNPMMIREVLNSGKNFLWRPYTSSEHACKDHIGWVRGSDINEDEELISLAHCLHACELVGMDCIEQYLPHRVAMQFGLDQDVPGDVRRANEDWGVAWETYDLEGKDVAVFTPCTEPGVTARYAEWWTQPLPPDLDVGAGSISVEGKLSKRKVKKTRAAMEAEAERERKMKKARISPSNDKKRKLEELYDAKLSDWLAAGRNGSSGTSGGSCKRGSSPKSVAGSDKSMSASAGTRDDIVLLVPRKQVSTPTVNLRKDRDMNLGRGDDGNLMAKSLVGTKYKGVYLKGSMAGDVDHLVNEPYFDETVVSTEISTFSEDAKDEWSDQILKNTSELIRGEPPAVPNMPEEVKPSVSMEREEYSDLLTDVDFSEDVIEEAITVDKLTNFSSAPEGGDAVMMEEKIVNLLEDKRLDATGRPEEGTIVSQELEKKAKLAVDESRGMSNRPEEVVALVTKDMEEKDNVAVAIEGTVVSEGVGRVGQGTSHSIGILSGSKQGAYAGVTNNPQETVALPEEILPVQQANDVGECVEMSCIMEDTCAAAGVATNDEETALDFVVDEEREISCKEETGGESDQMAMKDSKQKPQEAPPVDIVECGEDITLMEKDNEGEHENVPQTVEAVATGINMAAVLLGVPEEGSADVDKALNLTQKDAEDVHKKVAEVEDAEQVQINTMANGGADEGHNEVAEVEDVDIAEAEMHAHFDTEKPEEATEAGHADMDDGKRLTGRDIEEPGDVLEGAHAEAEKARELIENNDDDKLAEFPGITHAEMEEVKNLMKEDSDEKFDEVFDIQSTKMKGTHKPMEEDTDGKLQEVFDVEHAETKHTKVLIKGVADKKFEENSELRSIGIDGTHGPMEESTDDKVKAVPKVNAEAEQVNGTMMGNDRPDSILQIDLPARDETRCLAKKDIEEDNAEVPQRKRVNINNEEPIGKDAKQAKKDIEEDNAEVPQGKHANINDEAPIEKDAKQNPNAGGLDLPEKEVDGSKEVYQVKREEGEERKVLRAKDTEENTKDALGVKQAEERQGEALTAGYMYNYIEEITLVEQVDGQSKTLTRIGVEENPKDITQEQEKEFDNDTVESLKNSTNSLLCSPAIIQSKEGQKEVPVEGMTEKHCLQDVGLINERESLSDGAAMEIQGVDDHKTLDMHEEVSIKQINECGIIFTNKETQILEDSHMVGNGSNDFVLMEVDETWSTVEIQNQEALDLDKQQTTEERQDLGPTIENKKMAMLGDVITLGCCEFQADSPETKINEVLSTKGIQNQEHLDIKEEQASEKELGCIITEGNARPLVVVDTLGGGGADTTVAIVDVNKANCVEGIQNMEACGSEEARQDKQDNGVGDGRILEDMSANDSGDVGTRNQWDLCMENELVVLEKQDEGTTDENTGRMLVNTDAPECGEAKPDGTLKMNNDVLCTQAVNMAEDKISLQNQQKCVPLGDHNKSDPQEPTVLEKQDERTTDENTGRVLVNTDAPECGEAKPDGTMQMNNDALCTQAVNMAKDKVSSQNQQKCVPLGDHNKSNAEGSGWNQTARKESKGDLQSEFEHEIEVKQEILENKTELSIGRENDEASEQEQTYTESASIAPSGMDHRGENNNKGAEESIKNDGKHVSDPVNTGCQTSKFGRPSIEEVRRTHSSSISVYLKDITVYQERIRSDPSKNTHINNVGYYSRHGAVEPVSVSKDIKVPLHDTGRVCGRDRALELVTGPPEETPRWRQEQYALNILEDVQNARIAEKTRMEMEIRILKAQIASMQRQVMNMDHVGEVISRSKRH